MLLFQRMSSMIYYPVWGSGFISQELMSLGVSSGDIEVLFPNATGLKSRLNPLPVVTYDETTQGIGLKWESFVCSQWNYGLAMYD